MKKTDLIELIEKILEVKLISDTDFVKLTYFELKVTFNLTDDEIDDFLRLIRTKLENLEYDVYFTEAEYTYNNITTKVKSNELMIAIKNQV